MITEIDESKKLTKHISRQCKCKFDGKNVNQIKFGITINVVVSVQIQKNIMRAKKIISGILLHAVVKMVNM